MRIGDGAVVPAQKSKQHVCHEVLPGVIEPAHDPEINDGKPAIFPDEHVARMHIGMKEAIDEDLPEKDFSRDRHDPLGIVTGSLDSRRIVNTQAADPLQRHHPAGGAPPIYRRHLEPWMIGKIFRQFGSGGSLQPQVEFDPNTAGESCHDLLRPEPPGKGKKRLDKPCHRRKQSQIARELPLNPRTQHLYGHRLAFGGDGKMHLGNGGGRDRHGAEFGEKCG